MKRPFTLTDEVCEFYPELTDSLNRLFDLLRKIDRMYRIHSIKRHDIGKLYLLEEERKSDYEKVICITDQIWNQVNSWKDRIKKRLWKRVEDIALPRLYILKKRKSYIKKRMNDMLDRELSDSTLLRNRITNYDKYSSSFAFHTAVLYILKKRREDRGAERKSERRKERGGERRKERGGERREEKKAEKKGEEKKEDEKEEEEKKAEKKEEEKKKEEKKEEEEKKAEGMSFFQRLVSQF